MKKCWMFLLLLASQTAYSQNKVTLSGLITDAGSGETLIGAGVVCGKAGTSTNQYGFYSLTLPPGEGEVTYSYVGYKMQTISLTVSQDTTLNIQLQPDNVLGEAVVTGQGESGIASTRMSALEIPLAVFKSNPSLFGEADVLKTIQLLPGVQSGTEGFSGLYVRGGGPDENLLLLDGIPLYGTEHLLGLFSVFQPEAVKKVTLFKGSFPARYGGRVSSILDIRTNDGNLNETHGSIGVSMISDKFHLEGPLWKGRTAYSFSARGMHTLFLSPIIKSAGFNGNYYFYDVDAKLMHIFSDKDRLYFNAYTGKDAFHYGNQDTTDAELAMENQNLGIAWGNNVAALRWNHIWSPKLFSNTTVAYNRYHMRMTSDLLSREIREGGKVEEGRYNVNYNSGMRDWVAKADFDFMPSPSRQIKFGGEFTFHTFIPETLSSYVQEKTDGGVQVDTTIHFKSNARQEGYEVGVYAEGYYLLGENWTLNPGIRISLFRTQGKTYGSLEPRLSARYVFGEGWAAKASYSRMSQYVHLLSSSQLSLPMDLWVPITKDIRPEVSDQYSLGLYYNGFSGWEFSLEGYIKNSRNVLEYKEGVAFLFDSTGWEKKVEAGVGRAQGIELFVEKTTGKTTGWLGYTLAKSTRNFPTINHGEWFPYRYDRRHTMNLVVNHRFNERFGLSATWNYASGGVTTLPERQGIMVSPSGEFLYSNYVSSRNNYRLPPSHTLNLGINLHRKHTRGEGVWNLSVYNVYNRMNPNLVMKENKGSSVRLKKITFLPFFPSVGYTRSF